MSGSFKLASPPASWEGALPGGLATCSWVMVPGCGLVMEPGCCWVGGGCVFCPCACAKAAGMVHAIMTKSAARSTRMRRTGAITRPVEVCIEIPPKNLKMWTLVVLRQRIPETRFHIKNDGWGLAASEQLACAQINKSPAK